MVVHPAIPFLVGTAAIGALCWSLMELTPMPNALSSAHARLEGVSTLDGCATCHAGARGEVSAGCVACHVEIKAQLDENRGYHHHLIGEGPAECGRCHGEHNGVAFDLVNEISWGAQVAGAFKHPHVEFKLTGAHEDLQCAECHGGKHAPVFTLPAYPEAPRARTFLGLEQTCGRCHDDPHAGGLAADCARCHGQTKFDPPHFDHAKHFPLTGGHATSDCKLCHVIPGPETLPAAPPFPFDRARGSTCDGCHDGPHTALVDACDRCHPGADPDWRTALGRMTASMHDPVGFRLRGPHAEVACEKCHPRELGLHERYRDPKAPGYLRTEETCQGCHVDVHRGQFRGRYDRCLDCHEQHRFRPATFGLEAHARRFPLTSAHQAVACIVCHEEEKDGFRRFAGNERNCRSCHVSPHGPQFAKKIAEKDCIACHSPAADTFAIREWDHPARTGVALSGAHFHMAECNECHTPVPMNVAGKVVSVRRYEGTPQTDCAACHRDSHRGQFDYLGKETCQHCHTSWSWKDLKFDHAKQSRFQLLGKHAQVSCERCHVPERHADGKEFVRYRPLNMECRSCHDIPTADE